ncbi:MAG: hypothetical protein DI533_04760 [Cereibacter sphaeroides]|uniref:Uncharacterized protein n=1 Tax=Cereibacter sphaeroides TaxID=1063 RepID=A0A2W5SJV6_CERSP|nr:MAG: hypothetical protein DI533_04760 [Cereibacter sphaeroides]
MDQTLIAEMEVFDAMPGFMRQALANAIIPFRSSSVLRAVELDCLNGVPEWRAWADHANRIRAMRMPDDLI